jgi:cobalt-precorrin-5B (C1)-methyltransferase
MGSVARVAAERGLSAQVVKEMEQANTVEAVIEQMRHQPGAQAFWMDIEGRIGAHVHARVPAVKKVEIRLFDLAGTALGAAA